MAKMAGLVESDSRMALSTIEIRTVIIKDIVHLTKFKKCHDIQYTAKTG